MDPRKSVRKAIRRALGKRDPDADITTDSSGDPQHDSELRDKIRIPLHQSPEQYFEEKIQPNWPDAWLNKDSRYYDDQDEEYGKVGYEINFEKYFNDYEEPRSLEDIDSDIQELEEDIVREIRKVTNE